MTLHNAQFTSREIQSRLLLTAAVFLFLLALALTISPAARARDWQAELRWAHWGGLLAWGCTAFLASWQLQRSLPDADPFLLPVALLLTGWGMLSIWRLDESFGLRQTAWVVTSLVIFIVGLRIPGDLNFLRHYKYLWLTGGLTLTALTLILGTNPGGAGPRLWLGCCGLYFQPSEPLKLLLVIYLAAYFSSKVSLSGQILPLITPTLFLTSLALTILFIQRDLGTASIFVFLYAVMLYQASGRLRILFTSLLLLAGLGLVGYFSVDIITNRLNSWLDPWSDPSGRSYQIIQSLLATANGGVFGRGMGMGSPSLVPVAISDFIFTTIAEENGLAGTLALIAVFGLMVTRGYLIALRASDDFQRLLAAGLASYLGAQAILIIGGNLRLLPLTGVTLPFVSYGGTSLLTSFLALLLLLVISNNEQDDPAPLPQPSPFLLMPALLGLGLLAASLANGWWAVIRNNDLLVRSDNPRRSISDRYIARGSLLDRNNTPITLTSGQPGDLKRIYTYPALSPITGYTHPIYGQAGLEAELDNFLRGTSGYPASRIWWEHLLYGQPPPGLDLRLSIDLRLQSLANQAMNESKGAVVLLNAATGEVLVMASYPYYDPNLLDEIGADLNASPDSPLLNRAVQGEYPPAGAFSGFLLSISSKQASAKFPAQVRGGILPCTFLQGGKTSMSQALAAGCGNAVSQLGRALGQNPLQGLFRGLGVNGETESKNSAELATGQGLTITPLEMAQGAAALSNQGIRPFPRLVIAVKSPAQGWLILPASGENTQIFLAEEAALAAQALQVKGKPYWEVVARRIEPGRALTWYLGGTLPAWQGTPLAVAIVLESNEPIRARDLGRLLLEKSIGQ